MRSVTEYSLEEIQNGISKARKYQEEVNDRIRILFSPTTINADNFERVCDIYARLGAANYDTVVVVETHPEVLEKKLPMPSNKVFSTLLGPVSVNDYMRNEFCDEDDDFFIHDEVFSKDMSLFQQLMMLQASLKEFNALSIKIADESHFIVKELAHVLEEVLASRSVLLIFCCDLAGDYHSEFQRVKKMVQDKSHSNLFNYLNSGESRITGTAAFVAGIIVAHQWDMQFHFISNESDASLLTAYADRERVLH